MFKVTITSDNLGAKTAMLVSIGITWALSVTPIISKAQASSFSRLTHLNNSY